MKEIFIEEKYILEYIGDTINDCTLNSVAINDAIYHHNTSYNTASTIIEYGILSLEEQNRLGIKKYSYDFLKLMNDPDSHVNGNDGISLAVVGLTDLYPDELEYYPFSPLVVDFLISSSIKAYRNSTHYGNEFISFTSIAPTEFKSVDIRLLKHIEAIKHHESFYDTKESKDKLIKNYNDLRNVALMLKQTQLNIPLREMSINNESCLDIEKITKSPKLVLKK